MEERWGLEQRDGTYCEVLIARGEVRKPKCWKGHNTLTKKAKASGGGLADMGQQALGSVPTSDPLCLRPLSPVLSPITGIGLSQVIFVSVRTIKRHHHHLSSMTDTPSQ